MRARRRFRCWPRLECTAARAAREDDALAATSVPDASGTPAVVPSFQMPAYVSALSFQRPIVLPLIGAPVASKASNASVALRLAVEPAHRVSAGGA